MSTPDKYFNSSGAALPLGSRLGSGTAAHVYLHAQDPSTAVKIYKPAYLAREHTLAKRLQQLYKLSYVAALEVEFSGGPHIPATSPNWLQRLLGPDGKAGYHPLGSWPKELVLDGNGNIAGFTMDTCHNGIDLTEVVWARDPKMAFFKYSPAGKKFKGQALYQEWQSTFLYRPEALRNRFILCYYLAATFDRMYDLRTRTGAPIELQLCNFDIKPENILVSLHRRRGGTYIIPYILDLDNLTLINSTGRMAPMHPQHTPKYRAPEGPVDHFYDYFSIAVIFYQLLFSVHPYEGVQGDTRFTDGTESDFFVQQKCFPWGRNGRFLKRQAPQHENFPRLPKELQELFLRAFDPDIPSQRPGMREWSRAFLQVLSDRSVSFDRLFLFP